ncbi:hypothetical protein CTEN210_03958 [Chaetoceros tenuissimus]|uniref:C-type lectin domain-containing protein n=1 Tax=Chaetoceros tenuissimus TaxID=426638 RepID=A0AAD3CKB1_9STRA|nr:hypothetical protein CTEN210_03958 [Chaetoceros tenuissimus]
MQRCTKRATIGASLFVLVLGIIISVTIAIVLSNKRGSDKPTPTTPNENTGETPSPTSFPCIVSNELEKLQANMDGIFRLPETSAWEYTSSSMLRSSPRSVDKLPFNDYGCFFHDQEDNKSFLEYELSSSSTSLSESAPIDSLAKECHDLCDTKHFAITSSKCFCYVHAPTRRISMGTCASVTTTTCLDPELLIDAYMKINTNDICNQEKTEAVRNYFVEEDDAPFSYDIVSNTYRSSPFELTKDECGTNIYEVQTEVSAGSSALTTTSKTVTEYAESSRSHISSSIKASASFSAKVGFAKVKAKVSASADREVNSLMKSSGAQSSGSRVYTSYMVKRLSEIKILDFENKMNFVTFNNQFANLLRKYRDSAYDMSVAKEIFDKYGMFIVERGLFGGYRQIRATVKEAAISSFGSSESDFKRCYELSVSAKASGFGASVSGSTSVAGCSAEAKTEMNSLQNQYSEEVSTETLNGGKTEYSMTGVPYFEVNPDDSILLTDIDHYPAGDEGIELRPITEFLASSKISPLEVRRHLITETQFDTMKTRLEEQMIEILDGFNGILEECKSTNKDCLLSFLSQDKESCSCYERKNYICLNPEMKWYAGHQRVSIENGANLVKIECSGQNEIVKAFIGDKRVWIGANDMSKEDSFRYEDGSDLRYSNFAPGKPDNTNNEDCVEMGGPYGVEWNDRQCNVGLGAVYQVPWSPISGLECIEYPDCERKGYICLNPALKPYGDHQSIASDNEGSLVKIECSGQNEFVKALIGTKRAWIGANDISQEGLFTYEDGSYLKYSNFPPGYPNNINNEDCVEMGYPSGMKWNDRKCNNGVAAVYQVPSPISGLECIEYLGCTV